MTQLADGDVLDRYTIVQRIGAGGMGTIYRARDPRLQREVALKVLRFGSGPVPGDDGSGLLLREARAAAALDHPNVVSIYDVVEAETPEAARGTPYLVMELVDGRSLRDAFADASTAMETRIGWLTEIARALAAAHARGLVHRDVKPGNVMVRRDGVIKVLDFGIAKRIAPRVSLNAETASASHVSSQDPATFSGEGRIVGTLAYLSPEQLRGEPLDGRADQFSWGVMAYELLSGSRPWTNDGDAVHLVAEILSREPAPLHAVNPAVPAHVSSAVMRAMSKSATHRFSSTDELVRALDSASGPISAAASAPATTRAPDEAPRGRRRALVLGATALALACGAALIATRARREVSPLSPAASGVTITSPSAETSTSAGIATAAAPETVPSVDAPSVGASAASPSSTGRSTKSTPRGGRTAPASPRTSAQPPLFFPNSR